jgi:transposase
LLWDGSGFLLATKRLEWAFDWPKDEAAMAQMSLAQLRLLLDRF